MGAVSVVLKPQSMLKYVVRTSEFRCPDEMQARTEFVISAKSTKTDFLVIWQHLEGRVPVQDKGPLASWIVVPYDSYGSWG